MFATFQPKDLQANAPGLLLAAKSLLWKLSHNTQKPDGTSGPGQVDRNDATVRQLQAIIDRIDTPWYDDFLKTHPPALAEVQNSANSGTVSSG